MNLTLIQNNMTSTTKTNRNQSIVIKALLAVIFIMALVGGYVCNTVSTTDTTSSDSLAYYKMELKIEKKQHGKEQAILLNEAETERRLKVEALAKCDSLKQHENKVVAHYKGVIAKVVQIAPDSCKEYVEQVADACEIMLAAKDETNKALKEAQEQTQNELNDYYCLVEEYQAENVTDSLRLGVSEAETKKAKKEAKKQKRGKVVAWIAGGAMGILYIISNVIN